MCVDKTLEWLSVVSDRDVLSVFVTLDSEDLGRNISERQKVQSSWKVGKENK